MWIDRLNFELMTCPKHTGTFWTGTYDDEHRHSNHSVNYDDIRLFIMKVRHDIRKKYGKEYDWKYYITSEYGGTLGREHYHGIFTGLDCWNDSKIFSENWEHGYTKLGVANRATIRYCLKYIEKDDTRDTKEDEIIVNNEWVTKPFHVMSKGIGRKYMNEHADEMRENGGYRAGKVTKPLPEYYKRLLEVDRLPKPEYRIKRQEEEREKWSNENNNLITYTMDNYYERYGDKIIGLLTNDYKTDIGRVKEEWLKGKEMIELARKLTNEF